jgi:hypothetical protein
MNTHEKYELPDPPTSDDPEEWADFNQQMKRFGQENEWFFREDCEMSAQEYAEFCRNEG